MCLFQLGMRNAFDMEVPEIRYILNDGFVTRHIILSLKYSLSELGFSDSKSSDISERVIEQGLKYEKLEDYETAVHHFLMRT